MGADNHLQALQNEMDKFEALYIELYTNAVMEMPWKNDGYFGGRKSSFDFSNAMGFAVFNTELQDCSQDGNPRVMCSQSGTDACPDRKQLVASYTDVEVSSSLTRKRDGSMTNLFVDLSQSSFSEIPKQKAPQDIWNFVTNISPIFNRMRFLLNFGLSSMLYWIETSSSSATAVSSLLTSKNGLITQFGTLSNKRS
ncbi:hypothetical protein SK128_021323 [Halocaridina rubra]|uniref:Uncharacterized protein n=1 Tax=Halocaridina rubra TaxID=373956 RepID=A0AAN8WLY3_HALRR